MSAAGKQIAEQMEAIEKDFEDVEGFELGAIITIVGIDGPNGATNLRIRHNLPHPALVLGFMRLAEDEWLQFLRQPPPDADEE